MYVTRKFGSFEVEIKLTDEELFKAYATYQQIEDKENIEKFLKENYGYYNEIYKLNENPVTDEEITLMAKCLREWLNDDADGECSIYLCKPDDDTNKKRLTRIRTAVEEVLDVREQDVSLLVKKLKKELNKYERIDNLKEQKIGEIRTIEENGKALLCDSNITKETLQ